MRHLHWIICGLLILGVVAFSYFNQDLFSPGAVEVKVAQPSVSPTSTVFETEVDEQASVVVAVTPLGFPSRSGEWKFEVVLDTHSVELNQEMAEIAVLRDDRGGEYKPLRWEGSAPGGHHREGVLSFNSIQLVPKYVELRIKDVGGINERSFRWNLE